MIEVSQDSIERIHLLLSGIQGADRKVLKPALTRGLMAGKTQAGKGVRQTYRISAGDFGKYGRISLKSVSESGGDIVGSLTYSGTVIPLMKFKVNPSTPQQKKTPSAAVLKGGSLTKFGNQKNVFVAQMKSGHIGIFERQAGEYAGNRSGSTKHSEQLKELFSPAVPTMVGNDEVMEGVEARVNEVINQRIDHEIERILNKYGGS